MDLIWNYTPFTVYFISLFPSLSLSLSLSLVLFSSPRFLVLYYFFFAHLHLLSNAAFTLRGVNVKNQILTLLFSLPNNKSICLLSEQSIIIPLHKLLLAPSKKCSSTKHTASPADRVLVLNFSFAILLCCTSKPHD